MLKVKLRLGFVAGVAMALSACGGDTGGGSGSIPVYTGPGVPMPPELLACSTGMATPGCDKLAAGAKLAEMSVDQSVLNAFKAPQVGTIAMRATADGMRYGTDPVSCEDITAVPEAFDGAVRPGAAVELSNFIKTMSRDLLAKKGCV